MTQLKLQVIRSGRRLTLTVTLTPPRCDTLTDRPLHQNQYSKPKRRLEAKTKTQPPTIAYFGWMHAQLTLTLPTSISGALSRT